MAIHELPMNACMHALLVQFNKLHRSIDVVFLEEMFEMYVYFAT